MTPGEVHDGPGFTPSTATCSSDSREGRAVSNRALDIAKVIFEAEPEAALGDPAAVERVTEALAKISGAILATTLARYGEDALTDALCKVAKTMELEARRTATMMRALQDDAGDPPDTIN